MQVYLIDFLLWKPTKGFSNSGRVKLGLVCVVIFLGCLVYIHWDIALSSKPRGLWGPEA